MTIQPGVGAAYENPLIPNARLRQIYLALLKARLFESALRPARRSRTRGLEASLVSTAIDLLVGDVVSDALIGPTISFLRGSSLVSLLNPASAARRTRRKHATDAQYGAGASLPYTSRVAERLWAALGAAAALRLQPPRTCPQADPQPELPAPLGVAMIYALPGEVSAALWQSGLAFAAKHELPAIFVVLPGTHARMGRPASQPGRVSPMALRATVPGIAVDADDPVAIYRVAQESIGRARAGGGPALIECVPFVLEGEARRGAPDALCLLEGYILQRGVATQSWFDSESKSFSARLASFKAAR